MPHDRNKIAAALTPAQLDAFLADLAARPGKARTLEAIKAMAAEHGIAISLSSAQAFRNTTFERHLEKLRRSRETAAQVKEIAMQGGSLTEAAAEMLAQELFETMLARKDGDMEASEIEVGDLTLAISRLRRGDQQSQLVVVALEKAQAEIEKLKAENADRTRRAQEVEASATLSDEQKAGKWREIFGMA